MNKKILPVAVAAICAMSAMHNDAVAKDKVKSQSLGDLSCSENQIAEFDGDVWACIDTPSGVGGVPEYQFVDDEGSILGDVVYIEDAFTAWGYISGLSTSSTIQVTATYNKSGRSGTNLAGNLKRVRTWYESADCTGPAYVADYEGAPNFLAQNVYEPLPMPPFLAFLETETVYYQADVWNGQASTWNEVTLSSVTGVYDFESNNLTSDINNCGTFSLSGVSATQIDSFGIPIDAPVMPIYIIEK